MKYRLVQTSFLPINSAELHIFNGSGKNAPLALKAIAAQWNIRDCSTIQEQRKTDIVEQIMSQLRPSSLKRCPKITNDVFTKLGCKQCIYFALQFLPYYRTALPNSSANRWVFIKVTGCYSNICCALTTFTFTHVVYFFFKCLPAVSIFFWLNFGNSNNAFTTILKVRDKLCTKFKTYFLQQWAFQTASLS